MEFKEKLKERRACEESEKAKANLSSEAKADEDGLSSENQIKEVIDGNAKNEPENTDTLEDKSDHSEMNGELESLMQNGETAPDEDGKSSIHLLASQTPSKEITATNTEPALVNGVCKAADEVMPVGKETPKN